MLFRNQTPFNRLRVEAMGGVNFNDPSDVLVQRAFKETQNGLVQVAPMEWQDGHNMDFSRQLLRKRAGSALYTDLSSIMQSGETLIGGTFFSGNVINGTQFYEVIVGSKSIYINQYTGTTPGSFVQANGAWGAAFTHAATVSKCSFVSADGHLFILCDGANSIQKLRTGTTLGDQMGGDYTGSVATNTNVNVDSNSGQKVLSVASTTFINVYDRVRIGSGTGRDETGYVMSKTASSVTLFANLSFTHTAVQNDAVIVQNTYTQAIGGAAQNITGDWGQGYYIGMNLQQRFCFSKGDVAVEYTGATNPWDRFNGGAIAADGPIIAMETFTPRFSNLLGAIGVLHTQAEGAALQYISGFDQTDTIKTIAGASQPWNHRCVSSTMNWIVYPTRNRRWEATDGQHVIDVGRRLHAADGLSGPLDELGLTTAYTTGFSFYNYGKRQVQVYMPEIAGQSVNTSAIVLDMQLGEPTSFDSALGDTGSYSFEAGVRMLHWSTKDSQTTSPTTWFAHMYNALDATVGIMANGNLYHTESGTMDLDVVPVPFNCRSPDFIVGLPSIQKKWRRMGVRSLSQGDWDMGVNIYLDRDTSSLAAANWEWTQIPNGVATLGSLSTSFTLGVSPLGGGGMVAGHSWLEVASEALSFELDDSNQIGGSFVLATIDLDYQPANRQD